MATAYEVRIPVRTAGPAVPVRDVLVQTLPGAGDFPRNPTVAETGDDDQSQLLVSMVVDAADALRRAVGRAGGGDSGAARRRPRRGPRSSSGRPTYAPAGDSDIRSTATAAAG